MRIGVEAPVVVVAPTVATDPAMMTDAGDVVATAPAPATVKKVKTKPTLMAHRVCVMFTRTSSFLSSLLYFLVYRS